MAQSALTVTPPSPTPPTNMSFTGATPPNVPNFTKVNYAEPFGDLDANGNWTGTSLTPGDRKNPNPPPYFDDGAAGALHTFAANTAALASGTGATSGGTEGSYPGAAAGAVPASTSVAHEAAGTEVTVLAPGNISHTYPVGTLDMSRSASVGPAATQASRDAGPNASHASTLSPAVNPTFTSFTAGSSVSGVGTTTLSCVTVGATKQSVVYVNGVAQNTVFVSPTSLTCAAVTKKTTPGNWDIKIVTGGVVETAPRTWTFT
ncbi:MAG TPA: hypothetical protein VNG33_03075 [Polyangiaceae bacterium]|nr:hypothetical protein [Polyangiaceae bacterium]